MKSRYNEILMYGLIVLYLIFINMIGYRHWPRVIDTINNPFFWMFIAGLSFLIHHQKKQRIIDESTKQQIIIIIILTYLMMYFLSGLLFGYGKSIYNHSLLGILLNLWMYISVIISKEYVRNGLLKSTNKKSLYFLQIGIFIISDINISLFLQTTINEVEIIKQVSMIIIPTIALNLVLFYISKTSGYLACLLYRIPLVLTTILLPILPDLNWYFIAVFETILPFVTFIFIKHHHDKRNSRMLRKNNKITSSLTLIPICVILLLFISFVAGLFKYKPISILSNSMSPVFKRGDVIVFESIDELEASNLENYEIIVYHLDNLLVIHRIIAIEKHKETVSYLTKGDFNNMADRKKVSPKQILGVVKFKVPFIGYPAVWLSENTNSENVSVETGK